MHPVLIEIGRFKVHSYGTMLALAFVVGIVLTYWRLKRSREMDPDKVVDLALFVLVGAVIGARVLFILLNFSGYHRLSDMILVNRGGLSFHGGLLGAMAGAWLFARTNRLPTLQVFDFSAPAGALGYVITKFGCFLNGCCYGGPTDLPWACRFELRFGDMVQFTPPSHPTQIYDMLINLPVFFILWWLLRVKRYHGQVAYTWFMLYSLTRMFTEHFRQGVSAKYFLPNLLGERVTEAQLASALIVLVFGAVLALNRRRTHFQAEQVSALEEPGHEALPAEGANETGAER